MAEFQHVKSIRKIAADRWNAIAGGGAFASHSWLEFAEQIHAPDEPDIILKRNLQGQEAAVFLWTRRDEQLPVRGALLRSLLAPVLRRRPLLICQVPQAPFSGLFLEALSGSRSGTLGALVEKAHNLMRRKGASFMVFPYLTPESASDPGWGDRFLGVSLPSNQVLSIRWPDFESYLFHLRSSVRKDYRLHTNRAMRMGLRVEVLPSAPDPAAALHLIRNVERRHKSAPNPWAETLITAAPVPNGEWLWVTLDGRVVGCGQILKDRSNWSLTLLGLAPGVQQVYFALMWGAIRRAIEGGAERLYGGVGAERFKQRLGYVPARNNRVLFLSENRKLRRLGRWLAGRESLAQLLSVL